MRHTSPIPLSLTRLLLVVALATNLLVALPAATHASAQTEVPAADTAATTPVTKQLGNHQDPKPKHDPKKGSRKKAAKPT